MRFEREGAEAIDGPTAQQVEQGLRALQLPDSSYAILGLQELTYLQTAVDVDTDGTFTLEFQDGSLDEHYRASRPLELEDVVGAFVSYLRGDGDWRSRYQWEKIDARPAHPAPRPVRRRRRMSRARGLARDGVGLLWALVQLVILGGLFTAGGLLGSLGALVIPRYYGGPLIVGFVAGTVAGLVVNHSARMWLLRLRLWRLRERGRRVMATVEWVDEQFVVGGRGQSKTYYTVFVDWRDPVSGEEHEYERQYRFWGVGSKALEAALDDPTVPVVYDPAHPSRFVIDIPFAPTMADLVLGEGPGQVQEPSRPASSTAITAAAAPAVGRRSVGGMVLYSVLALVCLLLAVVLLRLGVEKVVAHTGTVTSLVLDFGFGLLFGAFAVGSAHEVFLHSGAGARRHQAGGSQRGRPAAGGARRRRPTGHR